MNIKIIFLRKKEEYNISFHPTYCAVRMHLLGFSYFRSHMSGLMASRISAVFCAFCLQMHLSLFYTFSHSPFNKLQVCVYVGESAAGHVFSRTHVALIVVGPNDRRPRRCLTVLKLLTARKSTGVTAPEKVFFKT